MAIDPKTDPRAVEQREAIPLDPELAGLASQYEALKKSMLMKRLATARDAQAGRDPRAGLASMYPDYGPRAPMTPAEKAEQARALAQTRAALTGRRATVGASASASSRAKSSIDDALSVITGAMSASATTTAKKMGVISQEIEGYRKDIATAEESIGSWEDLSGSDRSKLSEVVRKINLSADEGISNSSDYAELNSILVSLGDNAFAGLSWISQNTGMDIDDIMGALGENPETRTVLQEIKATHAGALADIKELKQLESAKWEQFREQGAYLGGDVRKFAEDVYKYRRELAEELRKPPGEQDQEKIEGINRALTALATETSVGASQGGSERLPGSPLPDPDMGRAHEDLDKAWDMLQSPESGDALQRLYAHTVQQDKFKEWKNLKYPGMDDWQAFLALQKEAKGYRKTAKRQASAQRRTNVITGATDATQAQEAAAKTVDYFKSVGGEGTDYEAEQQALREREEAAAAEAAGESVPAGKADPDLKRFFGKFDDVSWESETGEAPEAPPPPEAVGTGTTTTPGTEQTAAALRDLDEDDLYGSDKYGESTVGPINREIAAAFSGRTL